MATCIALRDLSVDCIVGIREREQRNLQPLVLDVRMEIAAPSLEAAASTGALDQSLNYSAVAKQLAFVCQHGQWGLLESLSTAICRLLLLEPAPGEGRAAVEAAELVVRKPKALDGLAVPEVTLRRGREWAAPAARARARRARGAPSRASRSSCSRRRRAPPPTARRSLRARAGRCPPTSRYLCSPAT